MRSPPALVLVLAPLFVATVVSAQKKPRPACAIVGTSLSKGLAWKRYEAFSPEPEPITFVQKHVKPSVEEREYDLRTDGVGLAEALRALDPDKRIDIRDYSNIFLFTKPIELAGNQVRLAARRAQLLIGLDLFFWLGYGRAPRPGSGYSKMDQAIHAALHRLKLQQRAFALFDELLAKKKCVLVVGDYPDLSLGHALALPANARPTRRTREELNRRLAAWAASRSRVFVYPLAERLRKAERGQLEGVIGGRMRVIRAEQITQFDGIHPNRIGTAFLLHDIAAFVRRHAPAAAPCLPADISVDTVMRALGVTVADLEYLATRIAKPRK